METIKNGQTNAKLNFKKEENSTREYSSNTQINLKETDTVELNIPISQEENREIFLSRISTTAQNIQEGNFLDASKIHASSFENITFEHFENGIYKILNKDGVALGFTDEYGKQAYENTKGIQVEDTSASKPIEPNPTPSPVLEHPYLQNEDLKSRGFQLTTDNPRYELSEKDFKEVAATMYAEAARGSYDDNLGVASTIAYRVESGQFGCSTLQEVVSQSGQFNGYENANYRDFIAAYDSHQLTPDMQVSIDVLKDVMHGIRNHTSYGFFTSQNKNKIIENGNGYKTTWK